MITSGNARWVVFAMIGGPLTLLLVWELATGRAWDKWIASYQRRDDPFDYWSCIAVQAILLALSIWFLLLKPLR
jgi:hypothetical protein